MAKEGDMSLFNDVLEPFRRVINTDPPKDKLSASSKLNFSDSNQSLKEGMHLISLINKVCILFHSLINLEPLVCFRAF